MVEKKSESSSCLPPSAVCCTMGLININLDVLIVVSAADAIASATVEFCVKQLLTFSDW